jgi:hypothetical protein
MVTACAWCPVTEETERAIRQGVPVSHGICQHHSVQLLLSIQGQGRFPVDSVELAHTTTEAA